MDNIRGNAAESARDALQRVGIALLTAASSSADDGVDSAYWVGTCLYATPILRYVAACAWFRQRIREIVSTKSRHSRKFRPSKI